MYTKAKIIEEINAGNIIISNFDPNRCGANSYDLTLAPFLKTYVSTLQILDPKENLKTEIWNIPEKGFIIVPGELYLGSTIEYTETLKSIPLLEGKSSIGRLGICVHLTAGVGDIGFKGHWTLEITCVRPVILYPYMPICQIMYQEPVGEIIYSYPGRYNNIDSNPVESRMFETKESWKKNE